MDKKELYSRTWKKWGNLQFVMVIEECSELIKAVTKHLRGKNTADIFEEAADVEIMIEQLRALSPEALRAIEKHKDEKLARLEKTMEVV